MKKIEELKKALAEWKRIYSEGTCCFNNCISDRQIEYLKDKISDLEEAIAKAEAETAE